MNIHIIRHIIMTAIFIFSLISVIVPCGIEYIDEELKDDICPNCGYRDLHIINKSKDKIYICNTCGQVYCVHKED